MKIQKSGRAFVINLPTAIVKAYGWDKGTELDITIEKNKSILLKEKWAPTITFIKSEKH